MDNRETKPAVEPQYEDPPPAEQKWWNLEITGITILVAVIFLVAIVVAIVIF